jgi:hypothetical protein
MAQKKSTHRQRRTTRDPAVTLEQYAELVTMLGLDGARDVIEAVRAGTPVKEIHTLTLPFIQRYAALPKAEREAHRRKVEEYTAHVRATGICKSAK